MFEKETDVVSESDKHSRPAFTKECTLMGNKLVEQKYLKTTKNEMPSYIQEAPSKQLSIHH